MASRSFYQVHRFVASTQNRSRCFVIRLAGICMFLGLVCGFANAQSTGLATITGTVTDPLGAVVAQIPVTILNVDTKVLLTSVTSKEGYFEIHDLNPGSYAISVVAPGYEKLLREGITLHADARLQIPLQLKLGEVASTVTVYADASLLSTEGKSSGQVLTTQQLESIPVSGDNTLQFAELAPGVQSPQSQGYSMDGTLGWNGVHNFGVAGNLGLNEFSLDGAPNEGNGRGNAISLSVDEVGEMKMEVSGFDPSVGHALGVSITQTTKAGTNDLHGSIRELYQNRRWAAMTLFQGLNYRHNQAVDSCTNGPSTSLQCFKDENRYGQPGVHENNGGFALGGPVFIPRLYDGRKKFFFFVSYDDDEYTDATSNTLNLPTMSERTGNFSDLPVQTSNIPTAYQAACGLGTSYYGQYQLFNPYSVTIDASGVPHRAPICGNIITPAMLPQNNAMAQLYTTLLPAPTNGNVTGSNYSYTNPIPQTFRQFTQRMDYAVSQSDHVYFRWTRGHYTRKGTGVLVGDVDVNQGPRWIETGALNWSHVFGPKTFLDVTVGATNYETFCCYYPGYEKYSPSSVGLPTYLDDYAGSGAGHTLPNIQFSNTYLNIGNANSLPAYYRSFAVRSNLTRIQGRHSLRAGYEFRLQNYAAAAQGNVAGTYAFSNMYTQEDNGTDPTYSPAGYGLSYASLLFGVPATSTVSYQTAESIGTPYYVGFMGDTWRALPRLTIDAGIRVEVELGPKEKHDRQIVAFDPNASLPIAGPANAAYQAAFAGAPAAVQAVLPTSLAVQGGPIYAGVNGADERTWHNDYRVMPRIGAVYQLNASTVIRGGYGIFFDTLNALIQPGQADQDGFNATTTASSSTTYGTNFSLAAPPLSDPFPVSNGSRFNAPIGSAAGAMYYAGANASIWDHSMVPPRAQRVQIGVQHQFGASTMLEIAWFGQITTDLTAPGRNMTAVPAQFYAGGQQPNVAGNSLLLTKIQNPFYLGNFGALAGSNPTQYNLIAHSSYYTQSTIAISNLVKQFPQMNGLNLVLPLAKSHFQEVQINASRRLSRGLTLMAALQINDEHDKNYFANPFDSQLSWQSSNNSAPYRFTAEGTYQLPLGHGKKWANSGWESAVLGGFQMSGTYEIQPGNLLTFPNLFYSGDTSQIRLKHQVYHENLKNGTGTYDYVQWFNPGNVTATLANGTCTYSGTGFVTNPQCQPNSYNLRAFPTHIEGVRQQGPNTVQLSMSKSIHLKDRLNLEVRGDAFNLLNRQLINAPDVNPTDGTFGQVTGDAKANGSGNARWIDIQGHLRF